MAIYTTLFGVLDSYVYVRTGSLLAAIVIHGMCNYLSIPSFSFWNSPKRYSIVYMIHLFISYFNKLCSRHSSLYLLIYNIFKSYSIKK